MIRVLPFALLTFILASISVPRIVVAQTGPDIGTIRRDHERAEEARRKEREAAQAQAAAKEREQAATRPSIERVKQLEAEVAARPTVSELDALRAENARLKSELESSRATVKSLEAERDALRKRLEEIRAAAAGR